MDKNYIDRFINEISGKIDGWFFPLDMILMYMIDAFQKTNGITGDIGEIGVWKGKSLVLLAAMARESEHIYALDLFSDNLLEETKKNIAEFAPADRMIEYIPGDTADYDPAAVSKIVTNQLRLLHIDAGHEYFEVLHTLYLFAPHLQENAVLIMDDYQDPEFPGIDAAVLDFCQTMSPRRYVPFLSGGNKLYLATPPLARAYQEFLATQEYFKDSMRLCRVRDFDILIAKSKLPVKTETLLRQMAAHFAPMQYSVDLEELAEKAKEFSQIRSMESGPADG